MSKKPVAAKGNRKVDAKGNYVVNADFSSAESLSDGKIWDFLTAGKGKATAEISGNALNITTTDCGELDYSVQVVQPNIFLEKGCGIPIQFSTPGADADRTIIPAITAPNARVDTLLPRHQNKTSRRAGRRTHSTLK